MERTTPMSAMEKLIVKLSDNKIKFDLVFSHVDFTPQVCVPSLKECVVDVICNKYAYGYRDGLLEAYSDNWVDARGFLNADEAYELIVNEIGK